MLNGRNGVLAAFLAALVVIAVQMALKRTDALQPDERTYLAVINDLVRTGTYTDGDMTSAGQAGKPGRFIAPAFPLVIGTLARVDGDLARAFQCLGAQKGKTVLRNSCGSLGTFNALQAVLAALGAAAVFAIARMLSGADAVAWGAMGVALASGEFAGYARLILTDTLTFTAFYLALAALVALVVHGRAGAAVGAGLALGLATLARPGFLYLLYATCLALLVLALWGRSWLPKARPTHGVLVLAGGLAVLAPWMLRNLAQFGDAGLTAGYAAFTLVQRVAYNAMTWGEWAASFVYWFPDIGDDLAALLFKPETTRRLNFNAPDGFYLQGAGRLATDTLAAAGGADRHLGYLLKHYVLGDPVKHLAVTFALAWRGLWAGKWIGVIALPLLWPVTRAMIARGMLAPFLALAVPLLFMVGLHAFVSVSIVRYNTPMLALFSFAIAFFAHEVWQRRRGMRTA